MDCGLWKWRWGFTTARSRAHESISRFATASTRSFKRVGEAEALRAAAIDRLALRLGFDGTELVDQLSSLRLKLAEPKSRILACREGIPFCGFRFLPGLRPRVLGATKRRFESRRRVFGSLREFRRLTLTVFAWYRSSREGNTEGLRSA